MKRLKMVVSLAVMLLLLFSTSSFALMMSDPDNGYEKAWHETALWQRLGDDNNANDGVSWSINGGALRSNLISGIRAGDCMIMINLKSGSIRIRPTD